MCACVHMCFGAGCSSHNNMTNNNNVIDNSNRIELFKLNYLVSHNNGNDDKSHYRCYYNNCYCTKISKNFPFNHRLGPLSLVSEMECLILTVNN